MSKQVRTVPAPSRLGRGLSSLIGSPALADIADTLPQTAPAPPGTAAASPGRGASLARDVPIEHIARNPYQPRKAFDPAELAELAASIRQQGLLQPLLVTRAPGAAAEAPYVLIAGERRLRAARDAGLAAVPCIIRHANERQMLEWSLIENIQRSDLNPIERAQAYRAYIDRFSLTQAEVAERTGESRASVANHLRLLDLCDQVQGFVLDGRLSFGHARALAGLAGQPQQQRALAERIAKEALSVRQAEQLVAAGQRDPGAAAPPAKARAPKPPYLADLEARLTESVGTRVSIRPAKAKNSGRIVIEYYSLDDFDRIAGALGLREEE